MAGRQVSRRRQSIRSPWRRCCANRSAPCRKAIAGGSCSRLRSSPRSPSCSWTSRSTASICARRARSWPCCATSRGADARWFWPFTSCSTPSASATASCCSSTAASAAPARSRSCARAPEWRRPGWRRSSLRSPDAALVRHAPLRSLLAKELHELAGGRALWTMLLILCPLVGYSFWQAVALYGEASAAAREQPLLASGLSPLDGVPVPTFGALYVPVTLLFPFGALRRLRRATATRALRLRVRLPYRVPTLTAAKMTAIFAGLLAALVSAVSALAIWGALGGHLQVTETANLLLGHVLYGLLVGAIALFSASISESAATAALIALAFTIGSWVLDFALAGQPGLLGWISRLSLTQTLRSFEQGLLSMSLLLGMVAAIGGFTALAAVWLHPGVPPRSKLVRSTACIAIAAGVFAAATQIALSVDVSQDRRNSFPAADQKALAALREPLIITVHLAPEDPRHLDLRRAVLSKLERVVPRLTIRLATSGQSVVGSTSEEDYGVIEYAYAGRSDKSRSTSPREIIPLIYALAGQPAPTPAAGEEYPGYPLVASGSPALVWFFGGLPLLIVLAWWWSRRPPRIAAQFIKDGGQP